MSGLRKIIDYVQSTAEAISSALSVEVEIIDDEMYRVGGTNTMKSELGVKQKRGYVNSYVLKTRQHFVMTNPGHHSLCRDCDLQGNCYCSAGIFCPIELKGNGIGIISLMGFTPKQKDNLMGNSEQYMEFIVRMADMLASKVSEQRVLEEKNILSKQLEAIINTVNYGIVSINNEGKIVSFNQTAENLLGLKGSEAVGRLVAEVLPGSPLLKVLTTGKATIDKEIKYHNVPAKPQVLSNVYPINSGPKVVGAVESFRDFAEVHKLAYKLESNSMGYSFKNIIGNSPAMLRVKNRAKIVARNKSTILIEGESGTGKELFARAIHAASPESKAPFVAINCGAIPDTLLESELFGYEKGAFTGAKPGGKLGKFELADKGTLFLDEIGDMPLYLQVKILRVLQERVVQRLGSTKEVPINVRVISATNQNLVEKIEQGEFREDLYYRLNVIPLTVPPLRERKEDIQLLLKYFLGKYNRLLMKDIKGFSKDVLRLMLCYNWPGNVRELENAVEYAFNFTAGDYVEATYLPERIRNYRRNTVEDINLHQSELQKQERQMERDKLVELLQYYGTSVKEKDKVAAALGISRATLYRRLRRVGLTNYRVGVSN